MKKITRINEDWYFIKNTDEIPEKIPKNSTRVALPHTWNADDGTDGGNDYFRGKCLYMKKLSLDDIPDGEKYFLEFRGVNSEAEVFCNGVKVGEHKGGYSCFRVEITSALKGENLIAVLVDNSHNRRVYPTMADFTFYGGIYRDVYAISSHGSHFALDLYGSSGVKITPKMLPSGECEALISAFVATPSEDMKIAFLISDMEGATVASLSIAAQMSNSVKLEIENPHLWQGRADPYLYTATLTLSLGDTVLDELTERFGIREFSIDPELGFFLNGKPYPLRGVSRHQDRKGFGNALLPEHHREDIDLIIDVGANCVRLAHYQHDKYFYDLCDEKGLVVWAEIPYISKHEHDANENTMSQMKELVLQNYNHPSIFFWGLSNEITMAADDKEDIVANHKALNALVHTLDQTRLTGIACVSMCDINHPYIKIPDVVGYNHYFGWYGGNVSMNGPWFDKFHEEYPKIPVCVTEYGCEALDWHSSDPRQGDYTEEYQAYYHEELIKQLFSRKYIFATFVWNMFDFGADARSEGGESGQNHKGLVTFDRAYKKDAFYAYKANLSSEPFVHIAGKRYEERAESLTRITVYSNLPEVELVVNGESVSKKKSDFGFFKFEIPLSEETRIEAKAGKCTDVASFRRVRHFNEKYILKEKGAVLNWFDVKAPEGYFSLNDEIGEIIKTAKGKLLFAGLFSKFSKKLDTGMPMNEEMMKMLGGFSVLRFINTVGSMAEPPAKEELLALNEKLNKIKKPSAVAQKHEE